MIEDWIPFHRRLAKGKKRSLPRGVRFVYLELALEARATGGTIELPIDWTTLDAVHDLLGGKRSEVKDALEAFTKIDDTGVSPLKVVRDLTEHTIIVTKWIEWAGPKSSTERVRKHRELSKAGKLPATETLPTVSTGNDGNALQHSTVQEKTVQQSNGVSRVTAAHLPGLSELEAEIRKHDVFAALDARAIAKRQAEHMVTAPLKLAWVLTSIEQCAAAHESQGLNATSLQRLLVAFMRNARRPKDKPIESPEPPKIEDFSLAKYRKEKIQ